MKKITLILTLSLLFFRPINGQVVIANKGFEGKPAFGAIEFVLEDWFDCGYIDFPYESVPDIHPVRFRGAFPPSEGNTYVGMVVRDNETIESIGQALTSPLIKDVCHEFTIDLCKSRRYQSLSRITGLPMNYIEPIVLRIWGGNFKCDIAELLAESPIIDNLNWKTYSFEIKPSNNYNFIILEAYYSKEKVDPYCGHILIDNMSNITIKDCEK